MGGDGGGKVGWRGGSGVVGFRWWKCEKVG